MARVKAKGLRNIWGKELFLLTEGFQVIGVLVLGITQYAGNYPLGGSLYSPTLLFLVINCINSLVFAERPPHSSAHIVLTFLKLQKLRFELI